MGKTAAVIAIAALGIAVALVVRLRPDTASPASPDAGAAPSAVAAVAPAVHVHDDDARAPGGQPEPPAPPDAHPRAVPTEARAPLPGEEPTMPMTQFLKDVESNVIVARTPGPPLIPEEMVEDERAFAAEPIDAAWAPNAEAALLAKFAQMQGLKLIDLRVECRTAMCRVEMTQPSPAPGERPSFNSLVDSLGMKPRWILGMIGPGGAGLKTFAYLWRDGFAPKPPADQSNN